MAKNIPERAEVPLKCKWNLTSLFRDDSEWEKNLITLSTMLPKAEEAKKAVLDESTAAFLKVLKTFERYLMLEERLAYYAQLRVTEDEGASAAKAMFARFMDLSSRGQAAWSWLNPAIQALGDDFFAGCLANPAFADYRVFLGKIRRFKPHVLGEAEERLLALQAESAQTAQEAFSVLTNVDLNFGTVNSADAVYLCLLYAHERQECAQTGIHAVLFEF